MESNKDEAERRIKISINALNSNQLDKATRFLEKAQRLFPTDQAKSLLQSIKQNGRPPAKDEPPTNEDDSGVRHRSHGEDRASGNGATDSAKPYTSEQMDAVKKYVCVDCRYVRVRNSLSDVRQWSGCIYSVYYSPWASRQQITHLSTLSTFSSRSMALDYILV
uniref:DnaJ homolog subfamily B member 12 n=1 Tax=Esox lucius TaxID=8010 RepID=C1BY41_ESOLU|nr:DnaJ homolog subfamily B member 12 [Esox lucius]